MKTSIPRLRSIRYKDGRNITVLRQKQQGNVAGRLRRAVNRTISENDSEMLGYAVVTWHADGTVFPAFYNSDASPILSGQVPQYVKDVLLTETAARWAADE